MERAVFIIKPSAAHSAKAVSYTLTSAGCVIHSQRSVRLTRQQAEQATGYNPADTSNIEQEEKIAEFLSGPTTFMIVSKYNVYEHLNSAIGNAPLPKAKTEDEEAEYVNEDAAPFAPSSDSFLVLYGNSFYASPNESETEKDVRMFFPDVAVEPPVVPGFDKTFLDNAIYPTLTSGLVNLCKEKPENPVAFLGQWLLDNNPNVPTVDDGSAETA